MKPPFLWLGRSRLNGMTTPPYPEGTLDTLGFLVGGRLAIRRAVSWPWLHKVALLGSKNATFLARNQFFVVSLKINCSNHNGTHKRQLWLYTLNCHNISKRFAAGCYFERASTNLVDFSDKQIIILVCSWLRRAGNASQGVSIYFIRSIIPGEKKLLNQTKIGKSHWLLPPKNSKLSCKWLLTFPHYNYLRLEYLVVPSFEV